MTKNERKRKFKRQLKKFKEKISRNPQKALRYVLFIALAVILIGAVIHIGNAIRNNAKDRTGETLQSSEENVVSETTAAEAAAAESDAAVTPEATPTPTPKVSVSLSDGTLQNQITALIGTQYGEWSVYLKNLNTGESFSINNQSMYAASLIKLYVMKDIYPNMNTILQNAGDGSESTAYTYVSDLLEDMITVSDNDAYNTLVSLRSGTGNFTEGALLINDEIKDWGYSDTVISHSLVPAALEYTTTGEGSNVTSVEDCGKILEEIYNGTCVSASASQNMLDLLFGQETTYKIPEGIPDNVAVANKTGETEETDHDAAIVYGPDTDYILCIMSCDLAEEGGGIDVIQRISKIVYDYLNP